MKTVAVGEENGMKGWRRRSNARYTPKVHALSPVVCRRELKDCATHGEQRGDSKEMSHALHTSAKILFFFRRANFFHPAFLPVARRDFPPQRADLRRLLPN